MSVELIFGTVFLILIVGAFFLLFIRRVPKLTDKEIQDFSKKIKATEKLNPNHALLEAHKIFVAAISRLYPDPRLTAAQKISKIKERLPNESKIWHLHRRRNQMAHETDCSISSTQMDEGRKELIRALSALNK